MVTKRELKAQLRELHSPKPMNMNQALASANPTREIINRLRTPFSSSEQTFWNAAYFLSDRLNGGLHQTLTNSTGDLFDDVCNFVKDYCDIALFELFNQIAAVFPGGLVPPDRDERIDAVLQLSSADDDPFEELTDEIYRLESKFDYGLLLFADRHREDIPRLVHSK